MPNLERRGRCPASSRLECCSSIPQLGSSFHLPHPLSPSHALPALGAVPSLEGLWHLAHCLPFRLNPRNESSCSISLLLGHRPCSVARPCGITRLQCARHVELPGLPKRGKVSPTSVPSNTPPPLPAMPPPLPEPRFFLGGHPNLASSWKPRFCFPAVRVEAFTKGLTV